MLTAFCLAAHSFVSNAAGFYLVWVGLGAALAATLYTPAFAVVTRRFPNDFRRAIITLTFLGGLASTVFIPLTSALISALGWRDSLWVLAALQLLVCLPIHVLQLRNAPRSIMQLRTHQVATPKPLGSHMRRPEFILIGTFMVLLAATTVALPAHLVSLLREYGLSEVWVIAIPASIGAMQVLGRAVLFFFERRIDIHSANRLIPCLIPVGLTLLLLLPLMNDLRVMLVIVFVVLYGIGNGMLTIVKGTAIAQYVDVSRVASLNGALGLPIALARAGAPLLLGVLWSEQHGYRYGLLLLLSFSLAGIACLIAAQAMVARKKAASAERA